MKSIPEQRLDAATLQQRLQNFFPASPEAPLAVLPAPLPADSFVKLIQAELGRLKGAERVLL
mgnify:CR=1 FL=1